MRLGRIEGTSNSVALTDTAGNETAEDFNSVMFGSVKEDAGVTRDNATVEIFACVMLIDIDGTAVAEEFGCNTLELG